MILPGMFSPYLVVAAALLPGIVAWWTGRKLAASADDPALPELLLARQQRLVMVVTGAIAASLVLGGRHAYWAIPLIGVAILIGGFPLRRSLRIETGTLPGHLWRSAKSVLGGLGFWLLLAWTPDIVLSLDPRFRVLGLALLPLLLLWEHFFQRIWLRLHESVPLVSSELEPRFAAIVDRAGIAEPAVYRIGGPGTRYMNALAFPSEGRAMIGLGNALIELMEPDETAAIYAHELAHIEHFSPRRVRRLQLLARLLILLAVALPFLASRFVPSQALWVAWLWPLVVLAFLIQRGRSSQRHETESDLRAAALCGDPEVVIRALVKLHVHAFIPRRWPVDFERNATHPSLARRIQALRGQGSDAVASVGAPTVLRTARPGSVVVFDASRGYWFDGVPEGTPHDLESLRAHASSARSVAWPDLIELRVTTLGVDRALRATHHNGDSWSVPLAESDVAPTQRALDLVDVRLRRELGRSPAMAVQAVAAVTLFAMFFTGSVGILLLPIGLALTKPSTAALAALGAMSLSRGVLGIVSTEQSWIFPQPKVGMAIIAALGAVALWIAWRRAARDGKRDGARITSWVIGGVAAVLLLTVVYAVPHMSVTRLFDLPIMPALSITLFGLGAALVATGSGRTRAWGAVAAVASVATFAGKALFTSGNGTWNGVVTPAATAGELDRIDFSDQIGALRLSPGGQRYAVELYGARQGAGPRSSPALRFSVGDVGGGRRVIEALDLEFVDDDHMLVVRTASRGLELALERSDSGAVVWSLPIPELYNPELSVATIDRTWTISGDDAETDSLTVISGSATAPEARVRRLTRPDSLAEMPPIIVAGGTRVLIPNMSMRENVLFPLLMIGAYAPRIQLWEASDSGSHLIAEMDGMPGCEPIAADRSLCVTRSMRRAGIWMIESGVTRQLGDLPVRDMAGSMVTGPGATLTVTHGQSRVLHVDIDAQRARDIDLSADPMPPSEARVAGDRLAIIRQNGAQSQVLIYRVK